MYHRPKYHYSDETGRHAKLRCGHVIDVPEGCERKLYDCERCGRPPTAELAGMRRANGRLEWLWRGEWRPWHAEVQR